MTVATAPSPATSQIPPQSVETYELSLSRRTGKFRFRHPRGEWLCTKLAGQMEVLGNDNERGNMIVRCKLLLTDGVAHTYAPKDAAPPEFPESPEVELNTHTRLCYNRAGRKWRFRDERTKILHSNDILQYKGVINVNWFDGGTHLFHDGPSCIKDGIAYFRP